MNKSAHPRVELAGTVTVGPKGQVVIPAEARDKMNIKPGDKLIALYLPDKGSVGFIAEDRLQDIINQMGNNLESLKSVIKS